ANMRKVRPVGRVKIAAALEADNGTEQGLALTLTGIQRRAAALASSTIHPKERSASSHSPYPRPRRNGRPGNRSCLMRPLARSAPVAAHGAGSMTRLRGA